MEPVAFEVDVLGYAVVERVIAQIVAVQLAGQIRVPDVVDLRDTREDVAARRVRLPAGGRRCCGRLRAKKGISSVIFDSQVTGVEMSSMMSFGVVSMRR